MKNAGLLSIIGLSVLAVVIYFITKGKKVTPSQPIVSTISVDENEEERFTKAQVNEMLKKSDIQVKLDIQLQKLDQLKVRQKEAHAKYAIVDKDYNDFKDSGEKNFDKAMILDEMWHKAKNNAIRIDRQVSALEGVIRAIRYQMK